VGGLVAHRWGKRIGDRSREGRTQDGEREKSRKGRSAAAWRRRKNERGGEKFPLLRGGREKRGANTRTGKKGMF